MYNYRMNLVPTGTFSQAAYNAFLCDRNDSEPLTNKEFKILDTYVPNGDEDEEEDCADSIM